MKTLNRNYLFFLAISALLLVYFYFEQYFFTINFYDTYYVVSYFYLILPIFFIGSLVYMQHTLVIKLKKRIEKSSDPSHLKWLLYILSPNSYFKLNTLTRNYIIFLIICVCSFIYLYATESFYLADFNGSFQFISYYYFVLPLFLAGSIYYWKASRKLKE